MRHTGFILAAVLLLFLVTGCSKTYKDYEQFISDIINAQEEFLSRIGSASTPDEIAASALWFNNRLIELDRTGRMLKQKYPESAGWDAAPPDSLKDDWERFHAKWSEFEDRWDLEMEGDSNYRKMLYDPEVRAAFMELARTIDTVNFL